MKHDDTSSLLPNTLPSAVLGDDDGHALRAALLGPQTNTT